MLKPGWWAKFTGKDMQIKSGGKVFSGDYISINGDIVGGKVIVNGVEQVGMVATPKITLEIVGGSVGNVESNLGISCGDITGNAKAGMEIKCGNIGGKADAGMQIEAQDIGGDADAGMDIRARDIKGNAKAGMSIKANSVGGSVRSAF